jgi:hypothetical protein
MDINEDAKSQAEVENCCHVNRPTLKNDNFPSPYIHLGWATSEEELKEKFQRQTGYLFFNWRTRNSSGFPQM